MVEKEGDIYSLLPTSKSIMHQICYYLRKYHIPNMGVVVLRGNCPTNKDSWSWE